MIFKSLKIFIIVFATGFTVGSYLFGFFGRFLKIVSPKLCRFRKIYCWGAGSEFAK